MPNSLSMRYTRPAPGRYPSRYMGRSRCAIVVTCRRLKRLKVERSRPQGRLKHNPNQMKAEKMRFRVVLRFCTLRCGIQSTLSPL